MLDICAEEMLVTEFKRSSHTDLDSNFIPIIYFVTLGDMNLPKPLLSP